MKRTEISPRDDGNRFLMDFLNQTLQRIVEEEDVQFYEDYMNEQDPSILHFLLASGDDV